MLYFSPRADPSSGNIYRESPRRFKTLSGSIHMACSLECTACHIMGHTGCHVLSKAIFTIPSFSPLNFPVAEELCIETPTGSSLTLTLCIFPQSGIIQTPTAEQQAAAEHSPLPQGTAVPSSNPCQAQETWKATLCIMILTQGRWILPGSLCWQVAWVDRFFFFWWIIFNVTLKEVYCITIEPQLFSQLCSRVSINASQVSKQSWRLTTEWEQELALMRFK